MSAPETIGPGSADVPALNLENQKGLALPVYRSKIGEGA